MATSEKTTEPAVENPVPTTTVLIVTRHEQIAGEARRQLSAPGYSVRNYSRDEFIDVLAHGAPDLPDLAADAIDVALVDFEEPGTDRFPLHLALRAVLPRCQVILLCNGDQSGLVGDLLTAGEIRGFLVVDSDLDADCLASLIEQARVHRTGGYRPPPDLLCDMDDTEEEPEVAAGERGAVLVVDDDPVSCDMAKYILEQRGFSVRVAETAQRARRVLDRHSPDVVLMDVHLGNANGIELVSMLRRGLGSRNAGVPVVFVTGDRRPNTLYKAAGLNIQGYILKPYTPELLIQKAEAAVAAGRI